MNTSFNISWINQSNTEIYVQPQDKRFSDIDFNSLKLNLTWVIASFWKNIMIINLNFDNPLEISPNIEQDALIILFNASRKYIRGLSNNSDFIFGDDI